MNISPATRRPFSAEAREVVDAAIFRSLQQEGPATIRQLIQWHQGEFSRLQTLNAVERLRAAGKIVFADYDHPPFRPDELLRAFDHSL